LHHHWTVAGVALEEQSETIELSSDCSFPEFYLSEPPGLLQKKRTEERQVSVRYDIHDQGDDGRLLRFGMPRTMATTASSLKRLVVQEMP